MSQSMGRKRKREFMRNMAKAIYKEARKTGRIMKTRGVNWWRKTVVSRLAGLMGANK